MTELQVIEASAATAEAIARATSLVDENHEQEQNEQKTNELVNTINNKNKNNNRQKNFTGSCTTEPVSSPFPKALSQNQQETQPQHIVDLIEENVDGT
jgi:chorismate mutase